MVIVVIMWIVFTVLIGVYANSLNRDVAGYVILSLFISPLVTFIILAIVGSKVSTAVKHEKKIFSEIEHLEKLRGADLISDEEFETKKAALKRDYLQWTTPSNQEKGGITPWGCQKCGRHNDSNPNVCEKCGTVRNQQ